MGVERILGLLSSNIAQPFLRARQYLPPAVGSAQPVARSKHGLIDFSPFAPRMNLRYRVELSQAEHDELNF